MFNQLNPRERLTALGAGLVILGWIVSLASYGIGAGTIALLGAIAVLAILYLKHAPNQKVAWPVPVSLLVLGISAVVALLVAIDFLSSIRVIGLFGATAILALLLQAGGAALMAWGAWQEYQVDKPAMPNLGNTTSTTPPPPPPAASTPPPAASTADPASPPSYPSSAPSYPSTTAADDRDEAPPA